MTKVQKKRSNSESTIDPKSVGQSPPKKQKKQVQSENGESTVDLKSVGQSPPKKQKKQGKSENGVARAVPKPAVEGEPLTASQKKRQKNKARKLAAIARVIEAGGVPKPFWPKKEKKTEAEKAAAAAAQPKPKTPEEKIKAKLEKRTEAKKLRQEKRQAEGQYKVDQVSLSADEIRLRIAEIKGRGEISKTAKRKLGVLIKKLAIEEGTALPEAKEGKAKNGDAGLNKSAKRRVRREKMEPSEASGDEEEDPNVEKVVDIQSFQLKKKNKKIDQIGGGKGKTVLQKNEKQEKKKKIEEAKVEEEEEESEEEEEDEDEAEAEAEAEEQEEEGSSEEEEEEDEEEEEEEEEEEAVQKPVAKKAKKEQNQAAKNEQSLTGKKEQNQGAKKEPNHDQNNSDKKKRYIFFVGNVPFDAKPEDIKSHFLTKVGEVSSVRIPTNPGTQTPRGFCYVEVTNSDDYEKGLSLHHTFINGRRINVEYTLAGSKQVSKRKELVSKNQKLHAMRKAGQLAGSQKHDQKRSVRRSKQREQPRTTN